MCHQRSGKMSLSIQQGAISKQFGMTGWQRWRDKYKGNALQIVFLHFYLRISQGAITATLSHSLPTPFFFLCRTWSSWFLMVHVISNLLYNHFLLFYAIDILYFCDKCSKHNLFRSIYISRTITSPLTTNGNHICSQMKVWLQS